MGNLDPNLDSSNTQKCKYHLHIDLDEEYEPLQNKNMCLRKNNVYLWYDGSLDPTDPTSMSTPRFKNITSLLKFVGDAHDGLLDYWNYLFSYNTQASNLNQFLSS